MQLSDLYTMINKFNFLDFWSIEMSAKTAEALTAFRKYMSAEDIQKITNFLNIPSGICDVTDPTAFLYKMSTWKKFDFSQFVIALQNVKPTLVEAAKQIDWLFKSRKVAQENTTAMSRFIETIRDELTFLDWRDILLSKGHFLEEGTKTQDILQMCLDHKVITNNISTFIECLKAIERNDVAGLISSFSAAFNKMSCDDFVTEFEKEAFKAKSTDIKMWSERLCEYTSGIFDKIEPILGSSQTLKLEEIYTPLTIVEYDPHIQKEQESGKTEIDLLRDMYSTKSVKNQDFLEMVKECEPEDKEAWILIGNPGSGKTWLCSRIALLYGHRSLIQFTFAISIPCRNQEWHDQEETRIAKDHKITSQSLQDWLLLGMPLGTDWAEQLVDHLVKTEGEGLLIIIDSVDEFTKNVPIESTILSALLLRRALRNSTLLVTSRPAAWNQASTKLSGLQIDQGPHSLKFLEFFLI